MSVRMPLPSWLDLKESTKPDSFAPKAPAFVHLELTRHCNLQCFYCTIRDNESPSPSSYSFEHFTKMIDRIAEAEVFEVSFFGGEPFLNPYIYELGKYAVHAGLVTNFLSNGTLIRRSEVEKIPDIFHSGTIALNGLEIDHDKAVGKHGAFKQSTRVISELLEVGFPVALDTLVSASNFTNLEDFLEWISENLSGVASIFLNVFAPYEGRNTNEVLSQAQMNNVYEIIDKFNHRAQLRDKISFGTSFPFCLVPKQYEYLRKSCSAGWLFGSVGVSGDVRICSWSAEILGNIFQYSLNEIWQNSKSRSYRSLGWVNGDTCADCDELASCLGGCRVTQRIPSYSVAKNWQKYLKPVKTERIEVESRPNSENNQGPFRVLRLSDGVRVRKERNGGLVYLTKVNQVFWLNNSSLVVLDLIDHGLNKVEIVQVLQQRYGLGEDIQKGLERSLSIFSKIGIIESSETNLSRPGSNHLN